MRHRDQSGSQALRHWWFALLLTVVLVSTAVAATPQGSSLVDGTVSAAGRYYEYLSVIFKW